MDVKQMYDWNALITYINSYIQLLPDMEFNDSIANENWKEQQNHRLKIKNNFQYIENEVENYLNKKPVKDYKIWEICATTNFSKFKNN